MIATPVSRRPAGHPAPAASTVRWTPGDPAGCLAGRRRSGPPTARASQRSSRRKA